MGWLRRFLHFPRDHHCFVILRTAGLLFRHELKLHTHIMLIGSSIIFYPWKRLSWRSSRPDRIFREKHNVNSQDKDGLTWQGGEEGRGPANVALHLLCSKENAVMTCLDCQEHIHTNTTQKCLFWEMSHSRRTLTIGKLHTHSDILQPCPIRIDTT